MLKCLRMLIAGLFLPAVLATSYTCEAKGFEKQQLPLLSQLYDYNFENFYYSSINVKDFGATGNGSDYDDGAIANAVKASGRDGVVYFPKGVYLIKKAIVSQFTGQKFIGQQAEIRISSELENSFFISHNNCEVNGFVIKGNGKTGKSINAGNAIYLQGTENCRIYNNLIQNTSGSGIALMIGTNVGTGVRSGCSFNRVENNKITGFNSSVADNSGVIIGYSDSVAQNNNVINENVIVGDFNCGHGIIILSNGFENKITNNTISSVRRYGIALYHPHNRSHYALEKNIISGNTITGVGIEAGSNYGSGIYLASTHYNLIFKNKLSRISLGSKENQLPLAGIALANSCWNKVSENKISDAVVNGIKVTSSNGNIFNANIISNSANGISAQNVLETTFSNNITDSIPGTGMQIICDTFTSILTHLAGAKWGTAISIMNNHIKSTGSAFNMAGSGVMITRSIVTNNTFEDSSVNTARFSKVSNSGISGNHIKSKNPKPLYLMLFADRFSEKNDISENAVSSVSNRADNGFRIENTNNDFEKNDASGALSYAKFGSVNNSSKRNLPSTSTTSKLHSISLDFPEAKPNTSKSIKVKVVGLNKGDTVDFGTDVFVLNGEWSVKVTAANTITVTFSNNDSVTVNPSKGMFTFLIHE